MSAYVRGIDSLQIFTKGGDSSGFAFGCNVAILKATDWFINVPELQQDAVALAYRKRLHHKLTSGELSTTSTKVVMFSGRYWDGYKIYEKLFGDFKCLVNTKIPGAYGDYTLNFLVLEIPKDRACLLQLPASEPSLVKEASENKTQKKSPQQLQST